MGARRSEQRNQHISIWIDKTPINMPGPPRYQNLSRFSVPADFRGRPLWYIQLWNLCYSILFRPSPQGLYGWRRMLLRAFGAKIGDGVIIRSDAQITYPWKLCIGDHSWIGNEVVLYSLGTINIGNNTVVSQRSYLCAGSHDHQSETFDITAKEIVIDDEAWLASDVFVAPGVHIGRGAVVGARSLVTKDLPAGMICHGNPAIAIRPRKHDRTTHSDSRN